MKPVCMDIREYRAWMDAMRICGEATSPCEDCTADFAREMRAEHKCLVWRADTWVLGRRGRGMDKAALVDARRRSREDEALERARLAEKARGMYDTGMSKAAIAREMGVCRNTVYALLDAA